MSCGEFGKRCRSVEAFRRENRIDEGTYGVVYRATDSETGEVVALKRVKMEREREGFPLTSVREFNTLLRCKHPNVIDVKEVAVGEADDSIFMVMEYVENDLRYVMEQMRRPFSVAEAKCIFRQLLEGLAFLHDNWVLHRDMKTSNVLYSNRGEVKVCDFGLARLYGGSSPARPYTPTVVTLWYRAPELLLGAKRYGPPIDTWSMGCIMAELLQGRPLFRGEGEVEQLNKLVDMLGTPTAHDWPTRGKEGEPGYAPGYLDMPSIKGGARLKQNPTARLREKFPKHSFHGGPTLSDAGFDLLRSLLAWDPAARPTAAEALRHEWFREAPLPKDAGLMPTFPARHEKNRDEEVVTANKHMGST